MKNQNFPSSPYAASKVAFDMHLKSVNKFLGFKMNIVDHQMHIVQVNYYTELYLGVLCLFLKEKIPLHGGGKAENLFTCNWSAEAIYLVIKKGRDVEIYNIGPDKPTSIKEVVERVVDKMNVKFSDAVEMTEDILVTLKILVRL